MTDATPNIVSHSATSGSRTARPRIVFWVERDPHGEYARYAADLVRAWGTDADCAVWLQHDSVPADFGTVPTRTGLRFSRLASFALTRDLRAARPDILVLIGAHAATRGLRAAKKIGVQKVLYVALSDLIYQDYSLFHVIRNYRTLNRIVKYADRIVVPANGSRYQFLLREWVPETKFYLLPKMFDPREVPVAPVASPFPARASGARPTCRVVYAGPFYNRARLDWLLRAWAFVEEKELGAVLSVVGTGPMEAELRALSERLGLRKCEILQPQQPLIHYVAAADIAAMTSLYELHARLPLMAMGCGKPIVAMEADGVRISLRNNAGGLLTPLGDPTAFAETLAALIQNPEQQEQLRASGRVRITQFEPEAFRDRARALLTTLLAEGAPS